MHFGILSETTLTFMLGKKTSTAFFIYTVFFDSFIKIFNTVIFFYFILRAPFRILNDISLLKRCLMSVLLTKKDHTNPRNRLKILVQMLTNKALFLKKKTQANVLRLF